MKQQKEEYGSHFLLSHLVRAEGFDPPIMRLAFHFDPENVLIPAAGLVARVP